MKIVVADDHEDMRGQLVGILEKLGHDLHILTDGIEIEGGIAAHSPDLVLTAHGMNKVNGDAAIAQLRPHNPELPMYIVSAHVGETPSPPGMRYVNDWRNVGATGYLSKEEYATFNQLLKNDEHALARLYQKAGFKTAENPVLVIDENEGNRALTQTHLRRAGFTYETFENNEAAQAELETNPHKYGFAIVNRMATAADRGLTFAQGMKEQLDFQGGVYVATLKPEELPPNHKRVQLQSLGLDGVIDKTDFNQADVIELTLNSLAKRHRYHLQP